MSLEKEIYKVLDNKTVLHVIFIVSVLNIIGLLVLNDFRSVLFFVLIALLIQHFNKNMIIVLGVPLILINLLKIQIKEGLEDRERPEDNEVSYKGKKQDGINKADREVYFEDAGLTGNC